MACRRVAMTAGLGLFTASLGLAALAPSLATFVAALFGVSTTCVMLASADVRVETRVCRISSSSFVSRALRRPLRMRMNASSSCRKMRFSAARRNCPATKPGALKNHAPP